MLKEQVLRGSIIFSLMLLCSYISNAQTHYLYKDDTSYFKSYDHVPPYTVLHTLVLYQIKDTLPDGLYIVYDVFKKDSLRKNKPIEQEASYVNGVRHGAYRLSQYKYDKKNIRLLSIYELEYKNGIVDGYERMYEITNDGNVVLNYLVTYKNGLRHGISIEASFGEIKEISFYEEGNLISTVYALDADKSMFESLMKNKFYPDPFKDAKEQHDRIKNQKRGR